MNKSSVKKEISASQVSQICLPVEEHAAKNLVKGLSKFVNGNIKDIDYNFGSQSHYPSICMFATNKSLSKDKIDFSKTIFFHSK